MQRFSQTIPDALDRIIFVPRLSRPNYLNLLAVSDVMLDPVHFGGGNSSYEGLAMGLPIVTLPAEYLRGRITFALYKKMGFTDCVANDADDYVRIAVRLGTNHDERSAMRQRINSSSSVLFHDLAGIGQLGDAFERMVLAKRAAFREESNLH